MPAPEPYDRQFSFTQYQAQHPSDPLPGDEVDAELNAVKASLDETQANLGLIQRDDGELANASVGADQLKPELSTGVSPAVPWAATTYFPENQSVFYVLSLYRCIEAHTSGVSFDSSKFVLLADLSSISIPSGSVGTAQMADGGVSTAKLAAGAVTLTKVGSLAGSTLVGRSSNTTGSAQAIPFASGTWTPADGSGAGLTITVTRATYQQVGNFTLADMVIVYPSTADVTAAKIGGAPFNFANVTGVGGAFAVSNGGTLAIGLPVANSKTFTFAASGGSALTNANLSGKTLRAQFLIPTT